MVAPTTIIATGRAAPATPATGATSHSGGTTGRRPAKSPIASAKVFRLAAARHHPRGAPPPWFRRARRCAPSVKVTKVLPKSHRAAWAPPAAPKRAAHSGIPRKAVLPNAPATATEALSRRPNRQRWYSKLASREMAVTESDSAGRTMLRHSSSRAPRRAE